MAFDEIDVEHSKMRDAGISHWTGVGKSKKEVDDQFDRDAKQ